MAKFGKKNTVDLNPLHYNLAIIGESGVGKTTLIKEVCETLAPEVDGEIGYLHLDIGKENGAEAIEGIITEPVKDWQKFDEVITDIVNNKSTDYPNLQSVIIDTYDQLMEIAEVEVVRMHNRENSDKPKITSINSRYGGFGRGLDKTIEIVFNKLWELKEVGVHFIVIGHTKTKDIDDPTTGESYQILTANSSQKYFNAIKTKLHVLGVAFIDRSIVKVKTDKKDFKGKEIEKKKITSEARVIKFRDDNFSVDSKSRFAEIIDEIPMDSDAFIKAIQDAIVAESTKSGRTKEQSEAIQKARDEAAEKSAKEYSEAKVKAENADELFAKHLSFIQDNFPDSSAEQKKEVKRVMAEYGFKKFSDDNVPLEALEVIVKVLKGE